MLCPRKKQIIFITANDLLIHNRNFHGVCHSTGKISPIFSRIYSILHIEMQLPQQGNGRKKCDFISARQYLSKKYLDLKV